MLEKLIDCVLGSGLVWQLVIVAVGLTAFLHK